MNPNVAIEIGWAMAKIPENGFLMVLNTHYGKRESVPFDLAHKGGPIMYCLPPNATKEQINKERAKLRGEFVNALRLFLYTTQPKTAPFMQTPSTSNIATFWKAGEVLASIESGPDWRRDLTEYRFHSNEAFYLRIIPTTSLAEPIKQVRLQKAAEKRPRVLASHRYGALLGRNAYGSIVYDTSNESDLDGFVQLFPNGEIWAASRTLTRRVNGTLMILAKQLEQTYTETLASLLQVANENMGIEPPFTIEMGAVGIQGSCLGLGHGGQPGRVSDTIHQPSIQMRCILNKIDEDTIVEVIEKFLEELYDIGGETRSEWLRE